MSTGASEEKDATTSKTGNKWQQRRAEFFEKWYDLAKELVVREQRASVAFLQKHFPEFTETDARSVQHRLRDNGVIAIRGRKCVVLAQRTTVASPGTSLISLRQVSSAAPANGVHPDEAPRLLATLLRVIGPERVKTAIQEFKSDLTVLEQLAQR